MMNYAETINTWKVTDSGRFGKAFEVNCKHYLNGKRGNYNKVSASGKTDVKHHGMTFEIKSNCGEIADNITRNTFVIYSPDNENDYAEPWNAFVIPSDEFLQGLKELGLLRNKVSTNGQVKTTIQTYRNSKKKTVAFLEWLATYPTVGECLK